MSTHLDFQLDVDCPILAQDFQLQKDTTIFHIAPKLHLFNNPAGTFILTLKKGAAVIASKSLTANQINAAILAQTNTGALAYKVGYFLFTFSFPINLRRDINYTIELSTSGYTFSAASSIGWIKEYLNETNLLNDIPENDLSNAFSYRLWGYKNA